LIVPQNRVAPTQAKTLTRIDFPADSDIVYSYDSCPNGKGRLCLVTDQSGSTAYEYTKKGQVSKETRIIDGVNYVTSYTYTMNGNVKTVTYPSGRVITYNYANNSVTGVLNNGSTLASNIGYLPFGGMTSLSFGNGLARTIGYDNQYRISTIQAGGLQSLSYGHDPNGNVTSMVNNLDNTKSKSYTYDDLNRLETGAGPWGTITWTYDPVGNRLTQVDSSGTSNYAYQTGSNRLSNITGPSPASFGYDENGNTITENAKAYSYNQNQRLIRAASTQTGDYVYNANGQRAKKTVAGTATHFIFDQQGSLIAETEQNGTVIAEYVYLNGEPMAKIDADGVNYIHTDHLGTPVMMSDAGGAKVWEIEARPFGDGATVTGTGSLNLRFPGQYNDAESGLNYNFFRDYNPAIGRYVEADPIGLAGGVNPFVYVSNNSINWIDPYGLAKIYGNWCGPNWTGGHVEQYTPHPPGYYSAPKDPLDSACKTHDICYYNCRQKFPCDKKKRSECFRDCDRVLTNSAYGIGGFWGNTIGAAINRPGTRDPGDDDCTCKKPIFSNYH